MKHFKQTIILILTLAMFINAVPAVYAEPADEAPEGETTEYVPEPLLGELKDYTEGHLMEEDLDLNYSLLLSEEMRNRMREDIDSLLNYEPISDESVSDFMNCVDDFVQSGGLSYSTATLQSSPLLAEKAGKLGLEETRDDLVEIIDTGSNSSGYIFVVDKDAVAIYVQDEEGNGIPHAIVVICWTEPNGNQHYKAQYTTEDPLPGCVAFTGLEDVDYITIDIEYEGYQAKTIIDKRVTLGGVLYYQLVPAEENSVYVRGADIEGKDLINEDTLLALVEKGSEELPLHVILSATGNATLPETIVLGDIATGRSITTRRKTSSYVLDRNSAIYTFNKDFLKKGNLLRAGDRLEIRFNGTFCYPFPHVTVEDAVVQPGTGDGNLPLVGNNDEVKLTDVLGGTGIVSITMNYLKVPITVGFFPEGGFIAVFSYEIESLTESYSSLFEQSWRPKTRAEGESILEPFKTAFWQNADRFKNGEGQLNQKNKLNFATDKNWKVSCSFSLYCSGIYNKETGNFDGSIGLCFDMSAKGGVTQYFLITTPVIVVPIYIGFELYGGSKAAISCNFLWNGIGDGMAAVFSADHTMVSRYDLVVGLDLFAGVGLRGVANVELSGGGSFDFARVVGTVEDPKPTTHDPTRFLIDAFTNLKVTVNLAFFSITAYKKTWGPWRLYDTHPDKVMERSFPEEELTYEAVDFDLSATQENAHLLLRGDEEGTLAQYKMDTLLTESIVNDYQSISLISENTFGDNQIQMVMTADRAALFRLLTMDGQSELVYQLMNPDTGKIMDYYSVIPMPDGHSPIEFHAVGNMEGLPYVYIAAVTADLNATTIEERANHTDVMGIIVDLHTGKIIYHKNMTNTWEGYYYYPRVAGSNDQLTVAYRHCKSYDLKDYSIVYMIPYNSTQEVLMGNGTLYTTGVILRNEPTFYIINKRWTDFWEDDRKLVVDGFRADGYNSETDPCYHIQMSIMDMEKRDNEEYISNWGFINGYNYCVIDGSLYFLERYGTGSGYGQRFKKVEGADDLVNRDSTYQFVLNNDATSLHVVTATENVEANMETGEYEIVGSTIKIYTLEAHYEAGVNVAKLHGPLEVYVDGIDINTFTAVYNTYYCQSKGLSLVYATTPEAKELENGKISYSDNLYQWQQNRERGMKTVGVDIPDFIIFKDQECVTAWIYYQNIGYAIEGPVKFRITDSSGKVLEEVKYNESKKSYEKIGTEVEHYPMNLYPGDVGRCKLLFEVNPEWEASNIEEITIEMTYPSDERLKSVITVPLNQNKMSLSGEDFTINDEHYANLRVTNLSTEEMGINKIAMEINYSDDSKEPRVTYVDVSRVTADPDRDGYNLTVLLQPYWDRAEKDGIKYIRFYLLDAEGNPLTGEPVVLYPVIEKEVEPAEIKYEVTEGADGTWEKGSEESYQLTVKRNIEDEYCFDHFSGLLIDENEPILDTDYTAVSGSTVITLNPSYLETLEEGENSVTVNFDDGVAETTLTIKVQEKEDEPVEPVEPVEPPVETGDTNNLTLWICLLGGSVALSLLVTILYLKRRKRD